MRTVELISDTQTIKFGDTATDLNLKVLNNGQLVNLDSKDTAQIKIRSDTGFIRSSDDTLVDVVEDTVNFKSAIFSGLAPGKYYLEIWLTQPDKGTLVYPDDGFVSLAITANAEDIVDGVITTLTLEEFKEQFDGLASDIQGKMDIITDRSAEMMNSLKKTDDSAKSTIQDANQVIADSKTATEQAKQVTSETEEVAKNISKTLSDMQAEIDGKQVTITDTGWQTDGIVLLNGATLYTGNATTDQESQPKYRVIDLGFAQKVILTGALQGITKKGTDVVQFPANLPVMDDNITGAFTMPGSSKNQVRWQWGATNFTMTVFDSTIDDTTWAANKVGSTQLWFPFYFEYWSTRGGA